ncbi:MAG: VWA domain-containing protein [Myxococcales bacterium]|nr:VWA domain-containing protein [Myxococcota bacterium]MDW8281771.1 VWA domain-containing protein [Myxococcales bacterium]
MVERLLEFIGLLRRNGVRASTAEVLDAVEAASLLGLGDPDSLTDGLRAVLCKRREDGEVFDELFELFFLRPGSFAARSEAPLLQALRERGLSEEEVEQVLAILASEAARLDPTARMALGLRRGQVEALIRLAGLKVDFGRLLSPLQIGYFSQQVLEQLRFRQAAADIRALGVPLRRALGEERAAQVLSLLEENLSTLRSAVRNHVQDEFARRNAQFVAQFRSQLLQHRPFGQMSEEELRQLRAEVERLARRLRQVASLRQRRARRGRLDVRRTLRRSLSTGGAPVNLRWRRRRQDRPRLVVLCDISDSVRHVSRFMLQFVYTLQELFARVRSFVFVSDLAEVTDLFQRYELHRAVELTCAGAVVNIHANSNFGRAFCQFQERYLEAVTTRTTVLIIGDGRNNYHPPEAWALERIRRRARHVLWLNPEPPASWSFGDSVMRSYEPHVSRIEVVYNLDSLRRVVDSLVL